MSDQMAPNGDQESPVDDRQSTIDEPECITWTLRLSDREPWKTWVVVFVAVMAALVGLILMRSPALASLGALIIAAATTDFWLPVRYKVDAKSCSLRCGFSVSSIEWPKVKRIILDEEGAKISPLAEESRLAPFRGVYLRFGQNRDIVVETLRRLAGNDVRFVDRGADGGADAGADPEGGGRNQEAEDANAGCPPARDA